MFANVWRKADSPPFFPEDFLDAGSREKRVAEHAREQREVAAANASLARITEGAPPTDDVPEWARATRTEA